jgi:ABC-type Fe3+-hydroxamate transport system substrate-binding protein
MRGCIAPQLEKRRDKWLEDLAASINQLQERVKGFKIEELGKSDVFVSAVLQASQIALRSRVKIS